MVGPEGFERGVEGAGGAGDVGELLGLEVVDILVEGIAGSGLGLDPVEAAMSMAE